MRVLLVTSRRPWPPHSGDRLRALLWLEALGGHAVTLVSPPGEQPGAGDAGVVAPRHRVDARRTVSSSLAAVLSAIPRRLPLHTLLAVRDWPRAIAGAARRDGPFDVAIVLLSRLVPWLPELPARHTILDSIDSAAVGMGERARAARGPARLFWERERRASERLERQAARRFDRVVAVTREESARFGVRGSTLPVGIEPRALPPVELEESGRPVDFAFWGRLPYFANRRAVHLILDRIWPRIRQRRPGATLIVGGAEAPRWLRNRDGRDGLRVVSPIDDREALLATVRVALLPIAYGSGQSLKTLEAAAAGCAIAGTPLAFRGADELAAAAVVEDDPDRLADRAAALAEDGWMAAGRDLHALALRHHGRPEILARMRRLVEETA